MGLFYAFKRPCTGYMDFRQTCYLTRLIAIEDPSQTEAAVECVLRLRNEARDIETSVAPAQGVTRHPLQDKLTIFERDLCGDRTVAPETAVDADVFL